MTDERANGQNGDQPAAPQPSRQYVQFIFYKVDPAWRALSVEARAAAKQEVEAVVGAMSDRMQIRPYSLVGIRGDADFMLWHIADDLAPFQEAATRLLGTRLGPYLTTPYAYLAMTRKSVYVDKGEPSAAARRLRVTPGTSKYLFVYPFVKTRPWYNLSQEQRQAMMDTHIRIGRKYPSVKLNTTYSFGLDDQEFVVSFETDAPGDFLDLVMELRETESSLYTLRDTPTFTCIATTVSDMIDALGVPAGAVVLASESITTDAAWTRVVSRSELPPGSKRTAYAHGEEVALFNVDGVLHAIEARCPHASAPLAEEGAVEGQILTCTRHGSQFDLARDCAVVRGPAARPPVVYDVKVEGGDVFIRARGSVPSGTSDQWASRA
ncbi:MAG: chlorite dismutase family protein [Chloroflexota bacterium]|nr:chlorite dismutase family protein [Chloroflexota bacterium]